MSEVMWSVEEARQHVGAAFAACRTSLKNAEAVAAALVRAELDGIPSHGLSRVPANAAQARAGKVDGYAVPRVTRPMPGTVLVDAATGFAYPALRAGLPVLVAAARQQGMAGAAIANSHHAGVLGHVVEDLALHGLIAMAVSNTPAGIAPWGGRRGLFGTNPIAFATPLLDRAPLVIDLSLSRVARGKIMLAAASGTAIPEGWAFDADGEPTTDAKAAVAGTMAPMGDAKGAQLVLMVELLATMLTGANFAYQASSMFDDKGGPPRLGQFILAIAPDAFGNQGTVEHATQLVAEMESQDGVRLPGSRRLAERQRIGREGIRLDGSLASSILALAGQSAGA
jgi:(2R)-3-sulfolactate dehydrogenase (NADP+)